MLRTVADETLNPAAPASVEDGTGSPEAIYSRTSAASTRLGRSVDSISTLMLRLLTILYGIRRGPDEPPAALEEVARRRASLTHDFTPVEPDLNERKYFAPNVGFILEIDQATGDRLELVAIQGP